MKKIVTVIGARPQFIKMALVSKALAREGIREIVVHTGQHYDKEMSGIFFKELGIARPKYNLGVGSLGRIRQIRKMSGSIKNILIQEKPELTLVYGDTNSTLAGAMAAHALNIPIAHVEAGLRSFNKNMPEEKNRVMTDKLSSVFFCPTRTAIGNLKREGRIRGLYLVGDVMYDSIKRYKKNINNPAGAGYSLCTIHRAENTDSARNLKNIFEALDFTGRNIIMPLHPRTAKCIRAYRIKPGRNIKMTKPVGYREMLGLENRAGIIITDSGGVQKEAFIFSVPCVTLRNETEWIETVNSGMNFLTGADPDKIITAIGRACAVKKRVDPERFYGDGKAHKRIASIIRKILEDKHE